MSMSTLLQEVRSALTGYSGLTDLIPANKITFARRPQRDQMPGLTVSLGNVDYEPVTQSYAAATTYRVDITVFEGSAQKCTAIHDQVKLALLAADSQNFRIRLFDERYFVDVDNVHQGYVSATWEMNSGVSGTDTVFLSPAFQGYDRMNFIVLDELTNLGTTAADVTTHGYYLDYQAHNGSATHTVTLPAAVDHKGKIWTFVFGGNLDNNSVIVFQPSSGRIEGVATYTIDRATSSMTIVSTPTSDTTWAWRITAYKGLHD